MPPDSRFGAIRRILETALERIAGVLRPGSANCKQHNNRDNSANSIHDRPHSLFIP
jgi:hypothetical protein